MKARQTSGVKRAVAVGVWALALVALGIGWRYLAPPWIGGATTYVTTSGGSMEPALHEGDLVLVRPADQYEVGDVVAYRSQTLGAVVLHRIVGVEGDRFITQGDANTWTDSDHPTPDQIIGSMALRVPGLGRKIGWARTPSGVAVLAGLVTLILGLGLLGGRRRRSRGHGSRVALPSDLGPDGASSLGNGHQRNGAARASSNGDAPTGATPSHRRGKARTEKGRVPPPRSMTTARGVLAVAVVVSLALTGLAFARPETTSVERAITYQQEGVYTYSAPITGGKAVYGPDGLATGDPVYLRLIDRLSITFDHSIDTSAAADGSGTIGLSATVSDTDGWRRTFELAAPAPFEGGLASVTGSLDLGRVRALLGNLQRATGVVRDSYSITVQALIEGSATISGHGVDLTFSPALPFVLSELELQLSPGDEDVQQLLAPVSGGVVAVRLPAPNHLSLFGASVSPRSLRDLAVAAAAACALALGALLLAGRRLRRRAEHERIDARYGRLLCAVDASGDDVLARTIEVASMETLVELAGHYDAVVLHADRSGRHTYFFRDGGVTYRYRAEPELTRAPQAVPD